MLTLVCMNCGKVFRRYAARTLDPKRACCGYRCRAQYAARIRDEAFSKDPLYRIGGRNPKEVLREGLVKAIDSGLVREVLRGEVSQGRKVGGMDRERVRKGQ